MTLNYKRFTVAIVALGVLGQPVFAQDLATQVVDEYFEQMTRGGMVVAPGAVKTSGKTVEWSQITVGLPNGQGSFTIPFVKAEEIGGGEVSITYPETMNFMIDPAGEQPKMDITVTTKGMKHIVSGTAAARDHKYSAQSLTAIVGSSIPGLKVNMSLSDLVGTQQVTIKGTGAEAFGHVVGSFKTAVMNLDYDVTQDGVTAKTKAVYNNVSGSFDMDEVSQANLGALTDGSRNVTFDLAMDSTEGTVDVTQPKMSMLVDMTTGATTAKYGVVDGVAQMSGVGLDAKYVVKMKDLPFPPFEVSMGKMDTIVEMPLKKVDGPSPARIQMGFDGLVASDTVWGMFDPTGQLPRDAARLNVDLSAQMRWLVDVAEVAGTRSIPVEMESVKINDLTLEIAGAAFNGTGSAEIDNSTMPPMPVGSIDLDLKGGMGLIDKLVAMGMVPQQQSMMVKGMAGMFTVPGGNGTDHLLSKIEMKKGGAILANGQRIK